MIQRLLARLGRKRWIVTINGWATTREISLEHALDRVANHCRYSINADSDRLYSAYDKIEWIKQTGYFEAPNWKIQREDK